MSSQGFLRALRRARFFLAFQGLALQTQVLFGPAASVPVSFFNVSRRDINAVSTAARAACSLVSSPAVDARVRDFCSKAHTQCELSSQRFLFALRRSARVWPTPFQGLAAQTQVPFEKLPAWPALALQSLTDRAQLRLAVRARASVVACPLSCESLGLLLQRLVP